MTEKVDLYPSLFNSLIAFVSFFVILMTITYCHLTFLNVLECGARPCSLDYIREWDRKKSPSHRSLKAQPQKCLSFHPQLFVSDDCDFVFVSVCKQCCAKKYKEDIAKVDKKLLKRPFVFLCFVQNKDH